MISRRRLILAAVFAAPLAALAQKPPAIARIGFLGQGAAAGMSKPIEALRAGLRDLGYVEGKNIAVEYRWAEGKLERLPEFVAELLRLKVEVIVAWGTAATFAAKRATATLPIVMVNVGDPVDTGLVATLARPGGNITGMSNLGGTVVAKQLELLTQMIPGITRIAVLRNPDNISLVSQVRGAESAARVLGLQLQIFDVRALKDFDAAFAAVAVARVQALLVLAEPLFLVQRERIAELSAKHRLPTVTARSEITDGGVLMSYGASTVEQFRGGAIYADKILRGAKPADLPVQQATTFELVVNLKTAKALGITIPQLVLGRADRVIE